MAKLNVFGIFDLKGKCYLPTMSFPHVGQAVRSFTDVVADPKTPIGAHAADYRLDRLATFDDNSGLFVALEHPEFVVNAIDLIVSVPVVADPVSV